MSAQPSAATPGADLISFQTLGGWKFSVQRTRIMAVTQHLSRANIEPDPPVEWRVYVDLPASACTAGAYVLVDVREAERLTALLSFEGLAGQIVETTLRLAKTFQGQL